MSGLKFFYLTIKVERVLLFFLYNQRVWVVIVGALNVSEVGVPPNGYKLNINLRLRSTGCAFDPFTLLVGWRDLRSLRGLRGVLRSLGVLRVSSGAAVDLPTASLIPVVDPAPVVGRDFPGSVGSDDVLTGTRYALGDEGDLTFQV